MKILVIRRDNIGDLVLTTPLIHALRKRFPSGEIDVLTNGYSAPALLNNPDVSTVFIYEKAHHREKRSVWAVYWERVRLILALRRKKYDFILLGKPNAEIRPLRLARMIGAPRVVGLTEPGSVFERRLTHPIYWREEIGPHIAQRSMQLLEALGEWEAAGPLRIFPDPARVASAQTALKARFGHLTDIIAIQISARKIRQRWPLERYAELMRHVHQRHGFVFALFWSPGPASNPKHPGDDEKAEALIQELGADFPCLPFPTRSLPELIAALAPMRAMITSDGGALHLGAASGLPILAFFGNSEAARWRPWGVPFELLQTGEDVAGITVEEALSAFERLMQKTGLGQKTPPQ